MRSKKLTRCWVIAATGLVFAGCGGGGSSGGSSGGSNGGSNPTPPAATHRVGGTVSGLAGQGLGLRLNDGNAVSIAANGSFTFPERLTSGTDYEVTIAAQPATPSQTCSVANASGRIASANIANVIVECVTNEYGIGGTVTGLAGEGLALSLNGGDALPVGAAPFTFPARLASGTAYAVTVAAQPANPAQECFVTGATGTVGGTDVAVGVECIDLAGTVAGVVTGLRGVGLELRNNGGDPFVVGTESRFRFRATIPAGNTYEVTVSRQPHLPRQTCAVSNATGTMGTEPVESVLVECVDQPGNLRASVPAPDYPATSNELATYTSLDSARHDGGFGRLAQDTRLDAAARAHAAYLAARFYEPGRFDRTRLSEAHVSGVMTAHAQEAGDALFTGLNPGDRARAAGYDWLDGAEATVFSVGNASGDCSDQVLDSVALRHRILDPAMRDIGIGIADTADGEGFACVILVAYSDERGVAPTGWLGAYPVDGTTQVSFAMAPDATGDRFGINRGMPVLFMADRDAPIALTVTVRHGVTNALVNTSTVTNDSDPDLVGTHQVVSVPSIYLEPDTEYTVHAVGTVEGLPVERTLRFTTGTRSNSAPFVPDRGSNTLRVVYAYPSDREFNEGFRLGAAYAVDHLQGWYQQQLGGETFSIFDTMADVCALPGDAAHYVDNAWWKILDDIQSCLPVKYGDPDHDWVIFADVIHGCIAEGRLNAGGDTLTMMQREALEGMVGLAKPFDECGATRPAYGMHRWIGLAGHEIGHTLGLPHACDRYQEGCDEYSLMWQGPLRYPAAHFAEPDREVLRANRFVNLQRFGR